MPQHALEESTTKPRLAIAEKSKSKVTDVIFAPASFAQESFWFLWQLEPDNPFYNLSFAINFKGKLDLDILRQSLTELGQRHDVFRTTFTITNDKPVQVIQPSFALSLPVTDLAHLPEDKRQAEAQRLARVESQQPFDLNNGPLLRLKLLRLADNNHQLIVTTHYIIFDDGSTNLFLQELARLYQTGSGGQATPVCPPLAQYKDFVERQQQWLQSEAMEHQLSYWKQVLGNDRSLLQLPTDRPRPARQTYRGDRQRLFLPATLTEKLKHLSQQENVGLYTSLLAAFKLLLYRYTGQAKILVGTTVNNRHQPEFQNVIGYFANMLPLRTEFGSDISFRTLLQQVQKTMADVHANGDIPFEKLVSTLQPNRNFSYSPIFQALFEFQKTVEPVRPHPDLELSVDDVDQGTTLFDLCLNVEEKTDTLAVMVEYNTDLFEEATIHRFLGHFQALLQGIISDPDRSISKTPILTEAERHQLLTAWNRTEADFPLDVCFQQLFEAQVERTPEAVAAVFEDSHLTYRQLNRQANRLAHVLVEHGVGPDVVVGLLDYRGLDLLTAIIAVLKAGGAYLPLDPYHPPERIRQVLKQSKTPLLLASKAFEATVTKALENIPVEEQPHILPLEAVLAQKYPDQNLPVRATPDHLAYVIFTSGSTGTPKGAMLEHKGMLNHIYAMVEILSLTPADRIAQNASQCFDISVWQFLTALMLGGQVHIYPESVTYDPLKLLQQIIRDEITIFETVPSVIRTMIEEVARNAAAVKPSALRWLIPTGEALPPELAGQWLNQYPNIPLLNAYGPSECSDDVTTCVIEQPPAKHIANMSIGRPVSNLTLYVLDRHLQPVPIGVAGELYIGGVGVGRGYLNNPERTALAFIPDPFTATPGARLYKTGDLVRYLPDGNLEFLGRVDFQVKIRGFRIELGEIEAVLTQHPHIREAVTMAREDTPGQKQLVAYVVSDQQTDLTVRELRDYLAEKLPVYMVPAIFMLLETMPLNANGKVDRKALPAPETSRLASDEDYQPPQTALEEVLAGVWADLLGLERIGINDNFFELGGHSLLVVQTISTLQEILQIQIPVRTFFDAPVVSKLAATLQQDSQTGPQVERTAQLVLELSQLSDEEVEDMLETITSGENS